MNDDQNDMNSIKTGSSWTTGGDEKIREIARGAHGTVLEMFNSKENRRFARKVIRTEDPELAPVIQNEIRVILALQKAGNHPNIIRILSHGWLQQDLCSSFYIDMDLCDSNLHDYIFRERIVQTEGCKGTDLNQIPTPVYVPKDCRFHVKLRNIWTIMTHISDGVKFLHDHGQVHRDLKPCNVLFSQRTKLWKIADFGISTEATSTNARSTKLARGTTSYRAPEILGDDPKYTNYLDIWALGCILYELVFEKKAFKTDVGAYSYGGSLDIPYLLEISKVLQSHLSAIIHELLSVVPESRPSAKEASILFHAYSLFLHPSHFDPDQSVFKLPLYHEWRSLIRQHRKDDQILHQIGRIYLERNSVAAARVGSELVRRNFASIARWHFLCEILSATVFDEETALSIWEETINRLPKGNSLGVELLALSYRRSHNFEAEAMAWEQLARLYPDNPEYLYLSSLAREGNVENTIIVSLPMSPLAIHPCHARPGWVSTDCEQSVHSVASTTPVSQVTDQNTEDGSTTSPGSMLQYSGYTKIGILGRLAMRQPHLHYFSHEYKNERALMMLEPCVIIHVAVIHSLYRCGCPNSFTGDHDSCKGSNTVRSLIVRRGTSCAQVYRDIVALHCISGCLIRLWRFSFGSYTTSCEPFLPDLVTSHANDGGDFYERSGSYNHLWLFLETQSDMSPLPYLEWAQFSEFYEYSFSPPILLFIKLFDVEKQELGNQQVIYLKSNDKVQALLSTIFITMKGRVADLLKINVYQELVGPRLERLSPELSFSKLGIRNGDTIVFSKPLTSQQIKKYRKMRKFVDPTQYYKSLDENVVLGLFPRHIERYGVPDLIQCKFEKSMKYEEMINAVISALDRPDFRIDDSQASNLMLFPSLLDGRPATEPIKLDAEAPVLQLIYDGDDGSNLPPLVFYGLENS